MSNGKIKFYKNPHRSAAADSAVRQSYVPEYRKLGASPVELNSPEGTLNNMPQITDLNNPRLRSLSIRQSYAEQPDQNKDQTWSGVDGDIIDDLSDQQVLSLDPNAEMIDNNDYVSVESNSFMTKRDIDEAVLEQAVYESALDNLKSYPSDTYILFVNNVVVFVGSLKEVQNEAALLVFGEHKLSDGVAVPIDDIVVLKKVNIKVGLFLE
jgi:hypothetical protein